MSIVLLFLCITAALMQFAVLRDKTIPEHELVEAFRYLRIAAYGITGIAVVYLLVQGHWLQPMLALSLILLALADTVGAATRLFPDLVKIEQAKASPRP